MKNHLEKHKLTLKLTILNHCPHNDNDIMHFPTYVFVYINIVFTLEKYLRNILRYFLNLLQQ